MMTTGEVQQPCVLSGADERTPSRATYFTWMNNYLEGATAAHTRANFRFFQWLRDTYGMTLDLYTFDAGALDCYWVQSYGSTDSDRFRRQFPDGFGPLAAEAQRFGARLGVWCGPDGFGDTPDEERQRTRQMAGLCKDHHFAHFKMDSCCGPLREEKQDAFVRMIEECRKYVPDLMVQNHCLNLRRGMPYATTSFWGGAEMYIDVCMVNDGCAPHHRAGALARGLVPDMKRLAEDHGVCLSSCLDGWDDELVTHAFGRALILAPEMYGSPCLLRDDEFPRLARLFNLYRRYGDILVDGIALPASYGPGAVARGDASRRLLVLRNLTWDPVSYPVKLDAEIGLAPGVEVEVRQFHPTEKRLGLFPYGEVVPVPVAPFGACLLYAGTARSPEPGVAGCEYRVIRDVPGQPVEIELLGLPGTSAKVELLPAGQFRKAELDGTNTPALLTGALAIDFPGTPLARPFHRKLADLQPCDMPPAAAALYEATVFAADNNALEVRSLLRSGGFSRNPAVRQAQEAFFQQPEFIESGLWDRNLFDGRADTGFWPNARFQGFGNVKIDGGCFRMDLGAVEEVDELMLDPGDRFGLDPMIGGHGYQAYVSTDLLTWRAVKFLGAVPLRVPIRGPMRYFKMGGSVHGINTSDSMPQRLLRVEGFRGGVPLVSTRWRASNLFRKDFSAVKAWRAGFTLDEVAEGSYLCIAIRGKHGVEGAYAAATIGGVYAGCPDRAPSYPSNGFGFKVAERDANYTYYLPLNASARGKPIEVFVLACDAQNSDLKPEAWMTTRQLPFKQHHLVLERQGSER
jgi:hypothetical protein